MRAYPVDIQLGNMRTNDAGLIEPFARLRDLIVTFRLMLRFAPVGSEIDDVRAAASKVSP